MRKDGGAEAVKELSESWRLVNISQCLMEKGKKNMLATTRIILRGRSMLLAELHSRLDSNRQGTRGSKNKITS